MYLPNILNPLKWVTWSSLDESLCKVWHLEELINSGYSGVFFVYKELADKRLLTIKAFRLGLYFTYFLGGINAGQLAKPYFKQIKPFFGGNKKLYKSLPDKVTLYRGISLAELKDAGINKDGSLANASKCGISWTPSKEFAKGYSLPNGYIIKTTIRKKRVKAIYEYSKGDLEFVFIPSDADTITLA